MSIAQVIQLIRSIVGAAFAHRNDPAKWGGWIDVHDTEARKIELDGKFTSAKVELSGLAFEFTVEGKTVKLEGRPDLKRLDVFIDGVADPEGGVVVASKATPSHPLRLGLDFRPVTFEGIECRFNLRFNG